MLRRSTYVIKTQQHLLNHLKWVADSVVMRMEGKQMMSFYRVCTIQIGLSNPKDCFMDNLFEEFYKYYYLILSFLRKQNFGIRVKVLFPFIVRF
jgi:hypothetical protein